MSVLEKYLNGDSLSSEVQIGDGSDLSDLSPIEPPKADFGRWHDMYFKSNSLEVCITLDPTKASPTLYVGEYAFSTAICI